MDLNLEQLLRDRKSGTAETPDRESLLLADRASR